MSQSSVDFLNMFVRPPGELLYFFTAIAISLGSLFMALGQRLREPTDLAARRYSSALAGSVFAWLILMGGALVSLLTDTDAVAILPPLERFVSLITILFITWAFISPRTDQARANSTIIIGVLTLLSFMFYIFTTIQWEDQAGQIDFNLSVLGATWTFIAALISISGMILILGGFSSIFDAPLKLLFFFLLSVGYGGTLYQIVEGNIIGDYAGPIRLASTGALAIIPALVYRTVIAQFETKLAISAQGSGTTSYSESRPKDSASPIERESVQLLRALGLILENTTADNVPERILSAVIEMLHVDVAAILRLQDANYADIAIAYDNIMKRSISGIAINLDNQPTLVNGIERLSQRVLTLEQHNEELQDIFTRLDINQRGPVYFQPMVQDHALVAVLMLATPYTKRELNSQQVELLKGIGVIASSLLTMSYAALEAQLLAEERAIQAMVHGVKPGDVERSEIVNARKELQANLQLARSQIAELSKQVVQLKLELDDERSRVAHNLSDTQEGMSVSQRMLVIRDEQIKLREERDKLSERLSEAEATLNSVLSSGDNTQVNDLNERLERERSDLIQEREHLQKQLDDLRSDDRVMVPNDLQSMIDQMSSENNRLTRERDQVQTKLLDIQSQLQAVGIEEGAAGLVQLINQLSEQRTDIQSQNETLRQERDSLLQQFNQYRELIEKEDERAARIKMLETNLQNLAGDREAAVKHRDQLKSELKDAHDKLELIKAHRARLLAQTSGFELELQEAYEEQNELRKQIQQIAKDRSELIQQRDQLLAEKRAAQTERDQLLARIEGDRTLITEVGSDGVGSLTAMIEELTQQRTQLEQQLAEAQHRSQSLGNELEAMRLRSIDDEDGSHYQPDNPDLLIGLVEELRTPMTSIIGYVDLLLGESAGILGEMQRKFLQRVSTNVTRLSIMLDDLINVTELDTGRFELHHSPVNILNLIEDSITNSANQFREKDLAVSLNIDEDLPSVEGDADSISQIIGQLLTNAYLVSPPSSQINITAKNDRFTLNGKLKDVLLFSVEDRGGGIPPEEEQRVFARKYKAENPLIQGLGDTGVGLSVAKALVDAHGGKLWLDSKENIGSIFTFVLPLNSETEGLSDAS